MGVLNEETVHANQTVPTIGILLKRYPKLSETFVLGELIGLEQAGLKLQIYSLYSPSDQSTHPQCSQVQAPVCYLPKLSGHHLKQYFTSHLNLFLRKPVRYLRALAFQFVHGDQMKWRGFLMAGWLGRQLWSTDIDHLHTHFISEPGSVAKLVHDLTGKSFSLSAHAKDVFLSRRDDLSRKLDSASFTVTCTEYNREYLQSLAPDHIIVYRMYHGIDFQRLSLPRKQTGVSSPEVPFILSVGRLREKKGFHVLVEACRMLKSLGTDFRCEIVGYGPEEEALQRQIVAAGLNEVVRLRGKLGHSEVIELFLRASVFVLPCIIGSDGDRDGIPNVILEALAMQVPVVSTPISGIPEIIHHGKTGLLVEPGRADALAHTLQQLLQDQRLRETLASTGYVHVRKQFSNEENLKLLQRLLTTPPVHPGLSEATRISRASMA